MEISDKGEQLELMFDFQDSLLTGYYEKIEDEKQNVICFASYLQAQRCQNKNASALNRLLSEAKRIKW